MHGTGNGATARGVVRRFRPFGGEAVAAGGERYHDLAITFRSAIAGPLRRAYIHCAFEDAEERLMLSRRALVLAGVGLAATGRDGIAAPIMTDDGIYREDWFLDSFLDLADDLNNTVATGKQLAIMWELRGCPYCRDTHLVNFARKDIESYIRAHFEILELNIVGSRVVTDFDGEKLGEKQLAAKYGVRYTPTIQFFPGRIADLAVKPPREREVNRIQGYLKPTDFIRMFSYVGERAYERGTLRDYLRSQS